MEKILVLGVEFDINDLAENVQKSIWEKSKDREKLIPIFAKSKFEAMRLEVLKCESVSSKLLKEMLEIEVAKYKRREVIKAIYKHCNFPQNDEARQLVAMSTYEGRCCVAKDIRTTSKFLNKMLIAEEKNTERIDVAELIIKNPNFTMEDETRKILAESLNWAFRNIVAADIGATSEELKQMLINECKYSRRQDDDVVESILDNPNFEMDEKMRKEFAISNPYSRLVVARDKKSSAQILEEMFKNETKCGRRDIIEAIIANPSFEYYRESEKFIKVSYLLKEVQNLKEIDLEELARKIVNI